MSDMSLRRGGDPKPFSSTFSSTSSPYAALPLYSPAPSSPTPSSRSRYGAPPQHTSSVLARPSLARFLADFTLGFADGLTVPFALTAGLSSLGQTDTVIYAGMAEICAGSISMGIGGYLSAKGEQQQTADATRADEEESSLGWVDEKASHHLAAATVERYLAPLGLPPEVQDLVRDHVQGRDDVVAALARQLQGGGGDGDDEEEPLSPIMSGLSVALGYLIGGSLPLFPYFVVSQVGDGLMWSFIVCIIALFSFGFTKDLVLHIRKESDRWVKDKDLGRRRWGWSDIRRSSWEGLQMVLLGSMAALAAVLCVRWFENMGHEQA